MNKKILFTFILFVLIPLAIGLVNSGSDDKATIESYLNNGGVITGSDSPVWTSGETDNPVWSQGENIPLRRYHGAGTIYKRNDTSWLYCLGGDYTEMGTPSLANSIYNITTNSWSAGDSMPSPGSFYGMAVTLGDTIYYMGGLEGPQFSDMQDFVKRYHVSSDTWSVGRNLPNTTADAECEAYQDSLIYIIGGLTNGTSTATANVWLYNRISGYRVASPLPNKRSGFASAIIGDTIFVICGGGSYSAFLSNTVYRGVISQSDRSSITWTTGTNYPGICRHRFDGDKWGCNGMIVGPGSSSGFDRTTECYVYRENNWIAQPPAPTSTAAAFYGSASSTGNIWRWVFASGLRIGFQGFTRILTDTLCTPQPPVQLTLCRSLGFTRPILSVVAARDTITVLGNEFCSIIDVNVRIDTVLYPWDSDLIFTLRKGGTTIPLITNRGSSGDNFIRTVLDDSASLHISQGSAPFTGSFRPEQPLSIYNGMSPSGQWILSVTAVAGGDSGYLKAWCMVISFTCPVGGIQTVEIPFTYRLSQNYPNPFNPTTTIKYGLPKPGNTKLVVYDILGRVVTTLVNEYKTAGTYSVNFDGNNLASGIYFYSLESGNYKETKKMLLIK
jgi:hypothetical protein